MDLLGGLGTGTKLLGEIMSGFGQFSAGKGEQVIHELNAAVARANAAAIRQSGDFEIRSLEKQKKRFGSSQRASYAKAGVRLEGSPISVLIDSAAEFETDLLISKYNTSVNEIQANLSGDVSKAQGKMASAKGLAGLGNTLLSVSQMKWE